METRRDGMVVGALDRWRLLRLRSASVARDYGIMSHLDHNALAAETIEIRKMLCGLRRRVMGE